jgi:anti-sigma regulatory factor (Ser/Thr protein kinase)
MATAKRFPIIEQKADVPNVMREVEHFLSHHKVPVTAIQDMMLALEESLINSLTHGATDAGPHQINLDVELHAGECTLIIIDDGIPFDPTILPPPDLKASLEDRPIGGLGVWLTRTLMDEMSYRRVDSYNWLTLRKRWP